MKKLYVIIIVFLGIGSNIFAQEKSAKEKKGDKYAFSYSFEKAIKEYSSVNNLTVEGLRNLASAYHSIDMNMESEEAYSKLVSSPEGVLPEDYYNYAMVLKTNGKMEMSDKWMDKFSELKPEDLRTKDYLSARSNLSALMTDDGKYRIGHLTVNTEALDFGTSYYNDKVVFVSSRTALKSGAKNYEWTGKPFWDMYVSDVAEGQLKAPVMFNESTNGKLHDGPASFSNNGTFMAFTRNNYTDKTKDRVVELQIFFSRFKDDKWSDPEPFVYNNPEYSVGHPCLTADGNTMYFTSDMPGGFGGADIYRTRRNDNGEWMKPENIGSQVNTEGDEMFPSLNENKAKLFFSSNGRYGLGGLDIFMCSVYGSQFGAVVNAGTPLNTQYNDYATVVNDNITEGYFSSDRPGGRGGDDIYSVAFLDPDVIFTVFAPANIPVERRVRETFPLRNYVFFNEGSTDIPERYVLLNKDQVKDFKEDQLEVFTPKELSGRAKRQLVVYYNVLNILGDRMGKEPLSIVRLDGASMQGTEDGLKMAESVKKYLVEVFGISPERLNTEGRVKPRIPSEQVGGTRELVLLREGDRRVSIWSESPGILMEFQSGPDAPLKPVEFVAIQEAPVESYVTFNVAGAAKAFSEWSLEIRDNNGVIQKFGPYTRETVTMPGKAILGSRPVGDFNVTMTGQTKSGNTVMKQAPVHIVLWAPPENEEMMRFSIIFEFNNSEAIALYEKYLSEIVMPKIPQNGKLLIHGHTDIIGETDHNQDLSVARANDVKAIFEKALSAAGRNDVKFEVFGFGEDEVLSPFENRYPEERFYNRTVIIDIIPAK
jgi:outer membrane protein OmpA-like peptidoglycan-associated protein